VENLNKALGVGSDSPEFVASQLIHLIDSPRFDLKLGFPERLFVFMNQLFPRINDKAIQKQLPTIKSIGVHHEKTLEQICNGFADLDATGLGSTQRGSTNVASRMITDCP